MDVLGLLLRAGVVFALLGITLWTVRRVDLGRSSGRTTAPVQVLSTTRLAKGASVCVVRIGTEAYALGVTEHGVSMLTTAELPVAEEPADVPGADEAPTGFAAALQAQVQQLVPRRRPSEAERTPVA